MTKQGRVLGSALYPENVISVTYATAIENNRTVPDTLGTSEPSPQISITVQASDFPTVSGVLASNLEYIAVIGASCQFVYSSGSRNINWKLRKNGSTIETGWGTVSGPNYGTVMSYLYDIQPSDVLSLALWATGSGCTLNWHGLHIIPSRLTVTDSDRLILGVDYTNVAQPTFTQGSPGTTSTSDLTVYNGSLSRTIGSANVLPACRSNDTYGIARCELGDVNATTQFNTHASYKPYYPKCYSVSQVKYTPTIFKV